MIKAPDVTLLYVVVSFLIAYAILKRFLFGPLGAILDEREQEQKAAARVHAESLAGLERAAKRCATGKLYGARGARISSANSKRRMPPPARRWWRPAGR